MKHCVIVLFFLVLTTAGRAASTYSPRVQESAITGFGTPTTVSISTSAWTKVPTTTLESRSGFIISLPATASANMAGHLQSCSSTVIATTVRPIEIVKGNGFTLFPVSNDVCLWLISLHTEAENVHVQEINQ
jgi:hypothetical protein